MKKRLALLIIGILALNACQHNATDYTGQYPDAVRPIFENKCATAGCHNEKSSSYASNLRLDTWQAMFKGSSSGAVVVPYNAANSSLCYFINTDSNLGPVLLPRMPVNQAPLSVSEYTAIKNWIESGAPDKAGNIPFSNQSTTRQKYYLSQQGCDMIAVIDAATQLIMRYIPVGNQANIEVPHCVRFDPQGNYAYVSFTQSPYLQKIDAQHDKLLNELYLGTGSWNLLHVSEDGKQGLVSDYSNINGKVVMVDLEKMTLLGSFEDLASPHGLASNPTFDTFWVTAQYGNTIYRITKKGNIKKISIDAHEPNYNANTLDPHEIIFSPDRSKYFVSCQASNEVRVLDAHSNALLKVIPVGTFPQEFAISLKQPYLFLTCQNELSTLFPSFVGSVYVINYNTLELVKKIEGPFYELHGISVDDENANVLVASRNIASSGPPPHHTSVCGGRNGYYSFIDLNTLSITNTRRYEATVDPYSSDIRFKK